MKFSKVKQAPVPTTRHRSERIDIDAYPFRLMSLGDMFEVIDESITEDTPAKEVKAAEMRLRSRIAAAIRRYQRIYNAEGVRFTVRKLGAARLGVWRVQ